MLAKKISYISIAKKHIITELLKQELGLSFDFKDKINMN